MRYQIPNMTKEIEEQKLKNAKIDVGFLFKNSSLDGMTTSSALLKLGEEYGELCASHLNKMNLANKSASSKPNVIEEAVDVLICTIDYLAKSDASVEDINKMIATKNEKWFNKIRKSLEISEIQGE